MKSRGNLYSFWKCRRLSTTVGDVGGSVDNCRRQ